uniref:CRISPR-associated endonuclease n=1 Tax=Siphoviridae sp. ctrpg19 TaxID=2826481 RepID=A0A8S5ML84_9CAUD|nr:MAG TPA: CRISPR-associated endonuclease [Siphoviridae sp. ctrpg19]
MNPNYIGYSVVDWKNESEYRIVDKGVFDISLINEKENNLNCSSEDKRKIYIKNKRDYEVIKIAHKLFDLAKHYKCEVFSIEKLNIKTKDLDKGRKLNKLVNNQWNRNKFINVLKKLVNSSSTALIEVDPKYSSILGNLIYREECLPDMILSSIEIGRRGIEFQNQYLLNIKERKKNIIQPDFDLVKERISKSLEELNIQSQIQNFQELYSVLKKSKVKYRFLLENSNISRVFSRNYKKSYIKLYSFV